jgi:hypothetical protein
MLFLISKLKGIYNNSKLQCFSKNKKYIRVEQELLEPLCENLVISRGFIGERKCFVS